MSRRGKKGKVGDRKLIKCPKCKRKTLHRFVQDNPNGKYWWECEKCRERVPARLQKAPSED